MYKIINVKNQAKKIIIMVLIVLLFNFVIPTYSQAGVILNLFANMLVFFPDNILDGLQEILLGEEKIEPTEGTYSIKLSPGTIFSGKIPLFNINFIKPVEDKSVSTWAIEPILKALIDNKKTKTKEKVTAFDIGAYERSIRTQFKRYW